MTLPFDSTQFFAVFARYNAAVWPAQIFLTVLAVVAIGLALRRRGWSDRVVGGVLGLFWVWMGVVYHWMFFRAINPAATLFGVLFVLEGIALVALGAVRRRLRFRFRATLQGLAGALLLAYALVAYPLLGHAADHRYPAMPTFGLPCPTTIFTLGLLLWTEPPVPRRLLLIPLAWSAIGGSAAVQLGAWEDLGLVGAGLLTAFLTLGTAQEMHHASRATLKRGPDHSEGTSTPSRRAPPEAGLSFSSSSGYRRPVSLLP